MPERPRRARPAPPAGGYSGTPLARKLGIQADSELYVGAAPPDYATLIAPLPEGVRRVTRIGQSTDVAHLFATQRRVLERTLQAALAAMRADAVLWVSWPKQASGVATDLTENVVREVALPLGLVDVKVCAVDGTWSALKLVVRKAQRGAHAARRGGR